MPKPRRKPAKSRLSHAAAQTIARRFTSLVVLLQLAVPFAFAIDPTNPPAAGSFWAAFWALFHRPAFYPLAALLTIGPAATVLALTIPGKHRIALILAWIIYIPLITYLDGHRIHVMLRVLIDHVIEF